jgi:hypothetical protein
MQISFWDVRLVKNNWNLGQIVDSEGWRKASGVAENDTVGAFLLKYLDAEKISPTFTITDV